MSTQPGHSLVVGAISTGQKAMMLCDWGVKADMMLFAGNTVWSISEREAFARRRAITNPRILYFTARMLFVVKFIQRIFDVDFIRETRSDAVHWVLVPSSRCHYVRQCGLTMGSRRHTARPLVFITDIRNYQMKGSEWEPGNTSYLVLPPTPYSASTANVIIKIDNNKILLYTLNGPWCSG